MEIINLYNFAAASNTVNIFFKADTTNEKLGISIY